MNIYYQMGFLLEGQIYDLTQLQANVRVLSTFKVSYDVQPVWCIK